MLRVVQIFISLLVAGTSFAQVVVLGHIRDTLNQKVLLYEPINGFCNPVIISDSTFKIEPDADGKFQRTVQINEPFQLVLAVGVGTVKFLGIPGDTVLLDIDAQKLSEGKPNAVVFYGKNKKAAALYLELCDPPIKMFENFKEDLSKVHFYGAPQRIELFDSVLNNQLLPWKNLFKIKEISAPYYSFITKSIKYGLIGDFVDEILLAKNYSFSEKMSIGETFYRNYKLSLDDPFLKNNTLRGSIAYWQCRFLQAKNDKVTDWFPDRYIYVNRKQYFLNGNLAPLQNLPKQMMEGYWAMNLIRYKQLFAGSFSQRDVDTYLAVFPNSPFKKYLQPPYYGFFPWNKEDSVSKVKLVTIGIKDNLDSIIQKYYKGKNVLVDIWATWCIPCKQEFLCNPVVDKYLESYDVGRLYISLDMLQNKEAMIKDIYAYHLSGTHVMATYALQQDIIKKIYNGKTDSLTIPRYIFINSTGVIVDRDMVRPCNERLFNSKVSKYAFKRTK